MSTVAGRSRALLLPKHSETLLPLLIKSLAATAGIEKSRLSKEIVYLFFATSECYINEHNETIVMQFYSALNEFLAPEVFKFFTFNQKKSLLYSVGKISYLSHNINLM